MGQPTKSISTCTKIFSKYIIKILPHPSLLNDPTIHYPEKKGKSPYHQYFGHQPLTPTTGTRKGGHQFCFGKNLSWT